MTRDLGLVLIDVAMTLGFLALAIAVAWWWLLFAAGSAWVGYRQLRLTTRGGSRPGASGR